jgi:Protein of unknown function (DUF998)
MAAGGVIGPIAFVMAWVACGWATTGYSPRGDAISQLAAIGAPTRLAMTMGFVVFGVGVLVYARPLARAVGGPAWSAAVICGAATIGVAAVPLGWISDGLHGALAGVGYAGLAATPLLVAPDLWRRGRVAPALASMAAAGLCAACLVATTFAPNQGLYQRLGLTIGDAWLVASAVLLLTRPPGRSRPAIRAASHPPSVPLGEP